MKDQPWPLARAYGNDALMRDGAKSWANAKTEELQ